MVFKLKTSKETMEIFAAIGASIHLQPYALCKIAVALAIRAQECLVEADFKTDNDGLELNRQTITGEYDDLFKALILQKENRSISDEEYFPKHLKAYIDKGAKMLDSEFKYSNNEFYKHLVQIDKGV
jgi:DNA sulfur modification protein DndE